MRGAIFVDDTYGSVWLCQQIIVAPAAPQPSCGYPTLLVQHPDAAGMQIDDVIADLLEAGQMGDLLERDGVRWAEAATFHGTIVDPLTEES